MNAFNDERIKTIYKILVSKQKKKIGRLLCNDYSKAFICYMKEKCDWRNFTDDVIRIKQAEGISPRRFIIKKRPVDDLGYRSEMISNIILSVEHPELVVNIRNIVADNENIYFVFDYHEEGTVHDFIVDNPRLSVKNTFRLFKACLSTLEGINRCKYQVNHFDSRNDNLFIEVHREWEDTDDEIGLDSPIVSDESSDDLEFTVRVGDLELCEFTLNKKRVENLWLPRHHKYFKKWGLYPRNYSECYDILYFLICAQDDLELIDKHPYLVCIWEMIEDKFPEFDRNTFFNKEGRMNKSIALTHHDIRNILQKLEPIAERAAVDQRCIDSVNE
jgi:hypothetical protein